MNWKYLVGGILFLFVFSACSNEDESWNEKQFLQSFVAGFEDNAASRTSLVNGGKVHWVAGDQIVLFNENQKAIYTASSGGAQVEFVKTEGDNLAVDGTYTAVYPASAFNMDDKSITVKTAQTAQANGFDGDAAICKAVVTPTNWSEVSFHNVCALLKFSVASSMASNVGKLKLTAPNHLKSKATITDDGILTWGDSDTQEYTLSGSFSANTDYYLLVAPQTLTGGLTMSLCTTNDVLVNENAKRTTTKNTIFESSKMYALGEIRNIVASKEWYDGNPAATEFVIDTPEELIAFVQIANDDNYNESFSGKTVKMGGDIDLKGYEGSIVPIKHFHGTFDGQNHSIKNMRIVSSEENVGLFGCIYEQAVIKNVVLQGGEVVSTSKDVNNDGYMGALVGYAFKSGSFAEGSGAQIINCINLGCRVVSSGHKNVAGILGFAAVGTHVTIKKCINAAAVECNYWISDPATGGNAAGILNASNSDCCVSDCVNIGSIHSTKVAGGIISSSYSENDKFITGCYNASQVVAPREGMSWLWHSYGSGAIIGVVDSYSTPFNYLTCAYDDNLCDTPFWACANWSNELTTEYNKGWTSMKKSYSTMVSSLNNTFSDSPYQFVEGNTPTLVMK